MCIAIVEVSYYAKAASSPMETLKFIDQETFESRLLALQNNEQVSRIKIFKPTQTHTRTSVWETTETPRTE